jgi:DNA-binding transcriptional ArsR family regulator
MLVIIMEHNQTFFEMEAEVINGMAHPIRLEILELLRDGEVCVCHIQAMLGQRQAYISQHLNVLRKAGLVTSRRDGLRVYYQASDPKVIEMLDKVRELLEALGMWQPSALGGADFAQRKTSCHCPQCSPEPDDTANAEMELERA